MTSKKETNIQAGSHVSLLFNLSLADGTLVDGTEEDKPMAFTLGDGTMIEGLELALLGLNAGDKQTLSIPPETGFGFPDPQAIQWMPLTDFPKELKPKAGQIIWKYKVLWIFGIFASCSATSGNAGSSARTTYGDSSVYIARALDNIDTWVWVAIGLVLFVMVLVVIAIVMALSTFGRIGLVQGTALADEDENAEITFSGLFNSGKPFFWRVLGMNLLIGVMFFILFALLGFFYLFASVVTLGLALICLLPLLCVLVPIIWFISSKMPPKTSPCSTILSVVAWAMLSTHPKPPSRMKATVSGSIMAA